MGPCTTAGAPPKKQGGTADESEPAVPLRRWIQPERRQGNPGRRSTDRGERYQGTTGKPLALIMQAAHRTNISTRKHNGAPYGLSEYPTERVVLVGFVT